MTAFTPADIGRRVLYRSTLPREDLPGVLVGLTAMAEFVVVRFDGDDRDEVASAELCEFVGEQKGSA